MTQSISLNPDVSLMRDFHLEVSRNHIPGMSIANAIGQIPDVDIADTPMSLWAAPGKGRYPWPAAAVSLELLSSSVNDTAAGTGVRTVTLVLLDASYVQFTVVVTTNGNTAVSIPGSYLRVNDMRITTVGSVGTNDGAVTLRIAGAGSTLSYMVAGKGRAQQGIYTIPSGSNGYSTYKKVGIIRSAAAASNATIELTTRTAGSGWVTRDTSQVGTQSNPSDTTNPPIYPLLGEKTDIEFVITDVTSNNTSVTCNLQILQILTSGSLVI